MFKFANCKRLQNEGLVRNLRKWFTKNPENHGDESCPLILGVTSQFRMTLQSFGPENKNFWGVMSS